MDPADVSRLDGLLDAGAAWDDACRDLAEDQLARAHVAREVGHVVTAYDCYRAGAACLLFAQMAHNFDTDRKRDLYRLFSAAVADAAQLAPRPWEKVAVAHGGARMHGILVEAAAPALGTVIVFGGQSGWGAAYLSQAEELNRRGMHAFLVEGPGQGQTRLEEGVFLDEQVAAAYSAFIDEVERRGQGPVALWGNSMGGLYAGLTAAADSRVAAVCINGAPARPQMLPFRTFRDQAMAMVGTAEAERAEAVFAGLALAEDARIACPVLVLHGGEDVIVSLAEQQPFIDATTNGTVRVWDDGEHTIYNHASERNAVVTDWLADQLRAAPCGNEEI